MVRASIFTPRLDALLLEAMLPAVRRCPAGISVLGVQGCNPRGRFWGQRGRARLWEPLFRSLAGAGLPLESGFGELGSWESWEDPQEQSERKHCSSPRHEGGEREAPPGGRDGAGKLGRVSGDHPGTGVGGSWPQGLRSGRQCPLGRRVLGSAGSPR